MDLDVFILLFTASGPLGDSYTLRGAPQASHKAPSVVIIFMHRLELSTSTCPLPYRDLRAEQQELRAHASQVRSGGRPAAPHRLPQLDTERGAEQHGEHPHHRGAGPGATLHQGVRQVMGAQRPGPTPKTSCSC